MTVPDFAARPQLSEDVARFVRRRIFDGTYAAGATCGWSSWPPELGISVTPVREALFELRAEGLLDQQPRRGFVVLPVTARDITDVSDVQAHIGGELAARAAANITAEQLRELRGSRRELESPTPATMMIGWCGSTTISTARSTSPRTHPSWRS